MLCLNHLWECATTPILVHLIIGLHQMFLCLVNHFHPIQLFHICNLHLPCYSALCLQCCAWWQVVSTNSPVANWQLLRNPVKSKRDCKNFVAVLCKWLVMLWKILSFIQMQQVQSEGVTYAQYWYDVWSKIFIDINSAIQVHLLLQTRATVVGANCFQRVLISSCTWMRRCLPAHFLLFGIHLHCSSIHLLSIDSRNHWSCVVNVILCMTYQETVWPPICVVLFNSHVQMFVVLKFPGNIQAFAMVTDRWPGWTHLCACTL